MWQWQFKCSTAYQLNQWLDACELYTHNMIICWPKLKTEIYYSSTLTYALVPISRLNISTAEEATPTPSHHRTPLRKKRRIKSSSTRYTQKYSEIDREGNWERESTISLEV